MMKTCNLLYILSSVFFFLFFIREYVAYKRILSLKYFFTPFLTSMLVAMMMLSVTSYGTDRYRLMILLSLLTALAADTLLMIEEISLLKNGMIFFILSHILYIGAFTADVTFKSWNIIFIIIIAVLSFLYIRVLIKTAGKMLIPVLIYILILDLMAYFAIIRLNNGITESGILLAAGSLLFMVSDLILSINAFVKTIPNSTVFTWLLYAPAQYLIVLSTFTS